MTSELLQRIKLWWLQFICPHNEIYGWESWQGSNNWENVNLNRLCLSCEKTWTRSRR